MEKMLAAQYLGPDHIAVHEVALPVLDHDEALVAIEACGFCGSDLNIVAGTHPRARAPLTVGHELAGRIVKIRSESIEFSVGNHVTMYPLISCGACYACTHGNAHVCRQLRLFGFDVDGGMAQFMKVPVSSLMHLPESMPAHIGALIEPLAVAVHGVRRASLSDVNVAVVLGAGPIGLLTALVAQSRGIRHVLISDVLQSRLDLAEELGLRGVPAGEPLQRLVAELSDSNGADILYECAGHPSSARAMTSLVRSRGVIVNLSVFKMPVELDMQAINFKEIELVGSRVYERRDFEEAIELAHRLPLEPIVSITFPLQDVDEAFQQFRSGKVCKVLIMPKQASS